MDVPEDRESQRRDTAQFGRFVLRLGERRLEKDDCPIRLGGRALDILISLVSRAGEVVSQQALQDEVWPNVTVDPVSLRVQMTALRKVLGDGEEAAQYIATIPNRGYCFVAPVAWKMLDACALVGADQTRLPKLRPLVGREYAVSSVITKLVEKRFVTLTGTGGIGKTAVAVAVAHALVSTFRDGVHFFDLSALASPAAVLVMLRRDVLRHYSISDQMFPPVAQAMGGKHALVVFDCCDHMAPAMGALAADLISQTDGVHVLVTSREITRAPGETVVRLPPLDYPADASVLSVDNLREYAAMRLLAQLIGAGGLRPSDDDLRAMAVMAAKLDGLPLALELAAYSIAETGIARTASLIASRFVLFLTNQSAALPRHESLNAALEWSYDQLTSEQKSVLRNLSVFVGPFTLEGVHGVAAEAGLDAPATLAALVTLSGKSLVSRDDRGEVPQYLLLDTTRSFAFSKLLTMGNAEAVKRRHAQYIENCFAEANAAAQGLPFGHNADRLSMHIQNVRAALEWCFSPRGDLALGARIAAASARVFLILGLNQEGKRWFTLALESLDATSIGTRLEFDIRFAISACNVSIIQNPVDMMNDAKAIVGLADQVGDAITRLETRAWECMTCVQLRHSDETLSAAIYLRQLALSMDDYPAQLLGDWVLGMVQHFRGALEQVAPLCKTAATLSFTRENVYFSSMQKTFQVAAVGSMARTLWLRGMPDAAIKMARAALDRPDSLFAKRSNVPIFFIPLYVWVGDWQASENLLQNAQEKLIIDENDGAFLGAFRGEICLKRGHFAEAVVLLQEYCDLHKERPLFAQMAVFSTDLAEAFAVSGQYMRAAQAMQTAFAVHEMFGESFFTPELYRVMGLVAAIAPLSVTPDAETWFLRAIDCAERQGSLSFRLRATTSLAQLYRCNGARGRARAMLSAVYNRFTEGFETIDLVAARNLLDQLGDAGNDVCHLSAMS